MPLISQAAFATKAGVSRQAITKAITVGTVRKRGNGKIDTTDSVNLEYVRKKQKERDKDQKKDNPERLTESVDKPDFHSLMDSGEYDHLFSGGQPEKIDNLTKANAEKLKIIEQIKQIQLKLAKERKELIPKELVQKVFGKIYAIDVNEFQTLPANIIADIASIVGIDDDEKITQLTEVIDKKVFRTLQHIKTTINKFLKEIDAEQITDKTPSV